MSNVNIARPSYAAAALLGRLLMGAIFVWSGLGKVLASTATIGYFAKLGLPLPSLAFTVTVPDFHRWVLYAHSRTDPGVLVYRNSPRCPY
jgi:uncharacterized membrane protein YphA (DoxX/SURF4 family)